MSELTKTPIDTDFIMSFIEVTGPRTVANRIKITPELADHLDGRCFILLDLPEFLEGVQFHKTDDGITVEHCSANGAGVAYCHDGRKKSEQIRMVDKYGEYCINDTYNGCTIFEMAFNPNTCHEVPVAAYEHIKHFVNQQIKIMEANQEYISSVREIILKNIGK